MTKLSYGKRKEMPKKDFALPSKRKGGKGGYPIEDKAHARNALARVAQHGSSEQKADVRRKVHAKYPAIGEGNKSMKPKHEKRRNAAEHERKGEKRYEKHEKRARKHESRGEQAHMKKMRRDVHVESI